MPSLHMLGVVLQHSSSVSPRHPLTLDSITSPGSLTDNPTHAGTYYGLNRDVQTMQRNCQTLLMYTFHIKFYIFELSLELSEGTVIFFNCSKWC